MEIKGHFGKTIFQGTNGYTVAVFELDDKSDDEITVTGYLPALNKESEYILSGEYVEHPRYGMQFNVESFEKLRISDEEQLIKYFSGPEFHGIGVKMATKIVEALGINAISMIKEYPDVLDDIKGMNLAKKEAIIEGLSKDLEDKYYFLSKNHLSMKTIMRLEAYYGEKMMDVITANPYRMAYDIDGIGFATADKFALSLGFPLDHPYRLTALADSLLLQWCIQSGDSYMDINEYLDKASREIEGNMDEIIDDLIKERRAVIEADRIYPITQYDAENYIAQYLTQFPYERFAQVNRVDIDNGIREIENEFGIEYQDKQKEAIEAFFENDLMILTGGPGTGKTTIVRGMVKLCKRLFPQYSITLCAPTGRASKRLSELTDCEARTVHSLLKWDKDTGRFAKDEDNPLAIDLLIVDEFSMLDQWTFYNLLKAGRYFKKIILIGDQDQLPSVGIGAVLRDLIACDLFKVVRLEKIYRQKEGSDIISLAYDIKHDSCEEINTEHEIRFFDTDSLQIKNVVLQVVEHALNNYSDTYEGFMNVQVLAPKYGGINGIDALNVALQKEFNPPSNNKKEIQVGYRTYREGDKILQLKNQPDDDVFNGDIGILIEVIPAKEDFDHQNRLIVDFDGSIVEYTSDTFINITHAYCISVHKAQGSEYPIVIMPFADEYGHMLQKKLIYTGVTRAYKSLIMVGSRNAFYRGIRRDDIYERKTTLCRKLLSASGFEQFSD